MAISDRIQGAKFSKGMAGYTTKEVDGFFADLLPIAREQEQLLYALRAKLDAFEKRNEEIAKKEQDAYSVLESARAEAEKIVATAEQKAASILVQTEAVSKAKAKELEDAAKRNAEAILAAADRQGKTILAEAITAANAEKETAKALRAECTVFESRFRTLVADTARSLAQMQAEAPKAAAPKAVPTVAPAPKAEPKAEKTAAEKVAPVPEVPVETQEISFAGGRPVPSAAEQAASPRRKPYESLTVTYDEDDDFDDIRKLKQESANKLKSPTHFSE